MYVNEFNLSNKFQKIKIQMSVRSFQFDANDYLFQLIQFYFKLNIKGTEHTETTGREREK